MQTEKHCQSFPMRIPASSRAAATELARRSGVSLNYFILTAIVERVERMDSEERTRWRLSQSEEIGAPFVVKEDRS